jgi:hypothetical protein
MSKKVYELPISNNYVHTWKLEDAVREIMQNAIDSQTDGHKLYIRYNNGQLSISNQGCNLSISDLVLGNSSKNDPTKYIGTYGEGFKLALIVLLRNNIDVRIITNNQLWLPSFRLSNKFKVETLHIDVESYEAYSQITFELNGIDSDVFEELRLNNLAMAKSLGYSIGETIPTMYGDILLDKQYKGKMFVNGLYVQSDYSFNYGYDFKPEFLHLDRDRKAISYYKMRELTAKALTAQGNVTLVRSGISKSYVDVRDIIDHMDEISNEFKVNFAKEFMTTHQLEENTFVGLEKDILIVKKEQPTVPTFKTDSTTIAQLVNAGLNRTEEYANIRKKVDGLSKIEEAQQSYRLSHFKELVDYLIKHRAKFNVDELTAYLKEWTDLHTTKFELIQDEVLAAFYEEEDSE